MPQPRFHFRLQKVLDLRLVDEKTAEQALSVVSGQCRVLELAIQDLLRRQHASFLGRGQAGVDWTVLRSYDLFHQRMVLEIEKTEKQLAAKLVEREQALAVYVEARKKVKVLEKLSERRREEFKDAVEKTEMLRLDDLNTAAFIRKMRPVEAELG